MKAFLKGFLILALGLGVGFAAFFAFTKTAFYTKLRQGEGPGVVQEAVPVLYYTDPDVGPMLLPHAKIRFRTPGFDTTVMTNRDGFTGRDYPLQKTNYRIAILGDSFVEAYGITDEGRFPQLAETMVYRKTNGRLKVDMMGFGVSGWGNVHHYGALKKYVLKYQPDEVWIAYLPANDDGDNTPLMNGPPGGPTFIYRGPQSNEIVDIRFGYVEVPDALQDERKRRYGDWAADTRAKWQDGLLPYFWSPEVNPQWEMVMDHTFQTLGLIKKLCDESGVKKVSIIYRIGAYEKFENSFATLKKGADAFLKRDLPMDQALGKRRFKDKVTQMGFGFIDTGEMKSPGISTRAEEVEVAYHANMADFFSDVVIRSFGPTASATK